MPPDTPQSTYPTPWALSSFSCSKSSVQRLLPPSMTRSPFVEQLAQLLDGVAGGLAVRHHHPDDARGVQPLHQVGEGAGVGDLLVAVVPDHLVPRAPQPLAHVAAHLAQPDQSQLHPCSSVSSRSSCVGLSRRLRRAAAGAARERRPGTGAQEAKRTGISTYRYDVSASPSSSAWPESTAGREDWVNETRVKSVPMTPRPSSR